MTIKGGGDTLMREVFLSNFDMDRCAKTGVVVKNAENGTSAIDVEMSDLEGLVGKLKEVFEGSGDKGNVGAMAREKAWPLLRDPKLQIEVTALVKDTHQGKLCLPTMFL